MAANDPKLQNAIDYYRDHLIVWYEAEYSRHIQAYNNVNLQIIGSFHGFQKLLQEYRRELAEVLGAVEVDETDKRDDEFERHKMELWRVNGIYLP